jgi:hypothetical protein
MAKKTLTDKAREAGLSPETVRRRIKSGWSEKKALSTPLQENKSHKKVKVQTPKIEGAVIRSDAEDFKKPADIDKYEDGFVLTISILFLAVAIFGILWLLTK